MAIDFVALQAAVDAAKKESDEATAAADALAAVNVRLAELQVEVDAAITAANKESTERSAALQAIIDLVSAGL